MPIIPAKTKSTDPFASIAAASVIGGALIAPDNVMAEDNETTLSQKQQQLLKIGAQRLQQEQETSKFTQKQQELIAIAQNRVNKQSTSQSQPVNKVSLPSIEFPEKPTYRKTSRGRKKTSIGDPEYANKVLDISNKIQNGEISARQLAPDQIEEIRKVRLSNIPEVAETGLSALSDNVDFLDSLAALTAFDPVEFGAILRNADKNIGIVETPDGVLLVVNKKTNKVAKINELGPSMIDAVQMGGAIAAFSPASVGSIPIIAGKSALIQTGIEALQTAKGGEFDVEDVALAGAAPFVIGGLLYSGKYGVNKAKDLIKQMGSNKYVLNPESGLPTIAFEKALERRGMDFGSIIDDIDNLPVLRGTKTPDEIVEDIIKHQAKTGSKSNALARLNVVDDKIIQDDLGIEAIRQGYREGDVAAAKAADELTRKEMKLMLNMQRQIISNSSKAQEFMPTDRVGASVMERFNYIKDNANKLRNELNSIAQKQFVSYNNRIGRGGDGLKGLPVDDRIVRNKFFDELDSLEINYTDRNNIPILDADAFKNSMISEDKTSQRIIKSVTRILSKDGNVDALKVHKIKRQLDTMLDFNKKSAPGLTDAGDKFAKNIRRALNDTIRDVSDDYAKTNDKLSMAIKSMNDFQKTLGGSIDVFADGAESAVGQDLRGLLSNRKTRIKLSNSVDNLDETAKKLGGKFKVNSRDLVQFANTLDDRFGAVAKTSLKGEAESVARKAARGKSGFRDYAEQKAAEKIEALRGINDKNAFNVMSKILDRKK